MHPTAPEDGHGAGGSSPSGIEVRIYQHGKLIRRRICAPDQAGTELEPWLGREAIEFEVALIERAPGDVVI